ncbi:distal tail protein Dit [Clostridioides sp. ES-S-0001-02]|uniref:distal tail protein Dit n=1 Tax=Clostridioides sp. ES-S-0001-02 TaxID=2770770 RepID=UPI001D10BE65|nr:phage tail family protein [Clostridioides sp. ES-S-0001-02]
MFFIYENQDSRELLRIKEMNNLSSPQRSIEKISVVGRNGDLTIDNGSFENFTLEIDCDIDAQSTDIEEVSTKLKTWLQKDFSYKKLFVNTTDFYYLAYCSNKLDISRIAKNFGEVLLQFDCMPFRYVNNDNEKIILDTINKNSTAITNFYRESFPEFFIEATGDIKIKINTQSVELRGIMENGILSDLIIDSEQMNVYRINKENNIIINENNKLFSDFPVLEEGENKISWEGNIKSIKINPRWNIL